MSDLAEDALDRLRAAHPGEHLYAPSEIRAAITGALVEREVALLTTRERLAKALAGAIFPKAVHPGAMRDCERYADALLASGAVVDAATLGRAIRTLLPGLKAANYVERWSPTSPAVQALAILCEFVGEKPEVAGDLQDPDVPTAHPRRPAGDPAALTERGRG